MGGHQLQTRSQLLFQLANSLEGDAERLAHIDSRDIGRTIFETRIDHRIALGQYRYFAAAIIAFEDFGRPIPNGYFIARRQPIGVCGQIIPWNVPAIMAAFKLAPALAAGNTVVLKPDENASLSTMELCKHIAKIFPPGVVNVVPGFGEEAGAALTAHPGVSKLAFTGSGEVGRIVGPAGARRLVPVFELGGRVPTSSFLTLTTSTPSSITPRLPEPTATANPVSLAPDFLCMKTYTLRSWTSLRATRTCRGGSPTEEDTKISCLVSKVQGEKVLDYISVGKKEGAKLVVGGERATVSGNEHGYFIKPTVFEARNTMRIAQEEIFGPVISIIRWSDFETMIAQANDVRYGLASGIFTSNLHNAMKTAERLEAGSVWVNEYFNLVDGTPFGGFKESGIGREYCRETLNMYSHLKSITLQ